MIKKLWNKMSIRLQKELISAGHTIVAAMVIEVGIQLNSYSDLFSWDKTILIAISSAIIRSGWKALVTLIISKIKK